MIGVVCSWPILNLHAQQSDCEKNITSIEYYNASRQKCKQDQDPVFYRLIRYDSLGKPCGLVKEYWMNDTLHFTGELRNENPDLYHGECKWFSPKGDLLVEGLYQSGQLIEHKVIDIEDYLPRYYSKNKLFRKVDKIVFQIGIPLSDTLNFMIGAAKLSFNLMDSCKMEEGLVILRVLNDLCVLEKNWQSYVAVNFKITDYYSSFGTPQEEDFFFQLLELSEYMHDPTSTGEVLMELGKLYLNQGELEESYDFLISAISMFEALEDYENLMEGLHLLISVYILEKDWPAAGKCINWSRELTDSLPNPHSDIDLLILEGTLAFHQQDYGVALNRFFQARREVSQIPDSTLSFHLMSEVHNWIGKTYGKLSDFDHCITYLDSVMAFQQDHCSMERTMSYLQLGLAYRERGNATDNKKDLATALLHMLIANRDLKALGKDQEVRFALVSADIAEIYLALGDLKNAAEVIAESGKVFEERELWGEYFKALSTVAAIHYKDGNYVLAEEIFRQAGVVVQEHELKQQEVIVIGNLAIVLCIQGKWEESIQMVEYYLYRKHFETREFANKYTRSVHQREASEVIEAGFFAALETEQLQKCWEYMEQIKAPALRKKLEDSDLHHFNYPERRNSILQRMAYLNEILKRRDIKGAIRLAYQEEKRELLDEMEVLDAELASYPQLIADSTETFAWGGTQDLEALVESLDSNETVVSYFCGSMYTYTFAVTSDNVYGFIVGSTDTIKNLVKDLNHDWVMASKSGLGGDRREMRESFLLFPGITSRLHGLLWEPLKQSGAVGKGRNKVLLLRDGPLLDLKFELLQPSAEVYMGDWSKYDYLIDQYVIYYAPGASVWTQLRSKSEQVRDSQGDFLGIGVDTFSVRDCIDITGQKWDQLNKSQEITTQIANSFEKRSVFIDDRSTETLLKTSDLKNVQYLHLQTHGQAFPQDPRQGRIALKGDLLNDGCLEMHEIAELELSADLVTLAACEIAQGAYQPGEGDIGFVNAFLGAGAHNVILANWEVFEGPTSWFFLHFYASLANNSKTEICQLFTEQIREMKKKKRFNHPYQWASISLYGSGS